MFSPGRTQNYAGDLTLPSASLVIRTIQSVFPSCRIFREDEPTGGKAGSSGRSGDPPAASSSEDGGDFTNMVIFCQNSPTRLTFRPPTPGDYLGSGARQQFLLPRWEIDPATFGRGRGEEEEVLLRTGRTAELERHQTRSAVDHWAIMRRVLPAEVWQLW